MKNINQENLYAVIMAGGKGTRFWPASRASHPKQLLAITGSDPMIRATVDRILPVIPGRRILVVTGQAHAQAIQNLLPDLPPENIVVEPMGRNTAPCIGLAAHLVLQKDPDGVMLVLPADHMIQKEGKFLTLAQTGARLAEEKEALITFGITPGYPETGYGYIEAEPETQASQAMPVRAFHEKPNLQTAEQYLDSGRFYWNSGMFVWKAAVILDHIKEFIPDLAAGLKNLAGFFGTGFDEALARLYPQLPSISIDFGVMEKARNVWVLPADIGWTDVGSWTSAAEFWSREKSNAIKGEALFIDSQDSVVYSPDKLTVMIGVRDMVVVDTPDALLICPKNRAQDIKEAVSILKKKNRSDLL